MADKELAGRTLRIFIVDDDAFVSVGMPES
jgi:hypothetical protein